MDSIQKVVAITGAPRRIGAELVRSFRRIGHGVIANSRSINASDVAGDPAIVLVCGDIAVPETASRIVSEAMLRFGRIDALLNNAVIFVPKPFIDYSEANFLVTTDVNLTGFLCLAESSCPDSGVRFWSYHLHCRVNRQHASTSVPAALADLTKGGLDAVTRSLAIEHASRGIRVNAVSSDAIKTSMNPPEMREFLAGLKSMSRMGEMHEVVDAVLYLEQAMFATGEILHEDCGACAGR